jgi:electron transfer flavoprotein beta subunit
MNTLVLAKLVPDLVEELSIDSSGTKLDTEFARFIVSEFDDHAIEEGILLKERLGGSVTVIGPDDEGIDDLLFTAAAKGADRLLKLKGVSAPELSNHALARICAEIFTDLMPDLVLTGVQAHNDLDGSLGMLLAGMLKLPYVGYVSGVALENDKLTVRKEYPAGLIGEMQLTLPAVLGIQAAEQPPRYVAVSKVRQAMKTASVEDRETAIPEEAGAAPVSRMYKPESTQRATMLAGTPDEIAEKLVGVFKDHGIL